MIQFFTIVANCFLIPSLLKKYSPIVNPRPIEFRFNVRKKIIDINQNSHE